MLFNSFHQTKFIYRTFHTSSPRHIHPLVWVFLKPALKGIAWLTGRTTRKWYQKLPPEKRSIFMEHLNRHKYKYLGIFGTIGTVAGIHYYTHLETVPVIGRKRYVVLNVAKMQSFLEMAKNNTAETYYSQILSEKSDLQCNCIPLSNRDPPKPLHFRKKNREY